MTRDVPCWPNEAAFQSGLIDYALTVCGFTRWYHTRDSRGSYFGFPDLVLVREPTARWSPRCVFAELKGPRGKVEKGQRDWHATLLAAGQEAYIWWYYDFDVADLEASPIAKVLRR